MKPELVVAWDNFLEKVETIRDERQETKSTLRESGST